MNHSIVEILIDASGSMGYMKGAKGEEGKYLIDGQTRMSLAKRILIDEIIPVIDYCSLLLIRTFRIHVEDNNGTIIQKETETPIIYQDRYDKAIIEALINNIEDPLLGGTPITRALEVAISDLKKFPNSDRKIILVTDGEEPDKKYFEVAEKAGNLDGIPCKLFIVGLSLDANAEKKCKEVATGGYINLTSKKFDALDLKVRLAAIKKQVLQNTIENIEARAQNISSNELKTEFVAATAIEPAVEELRIKIQTITEESKIASRKINLESEIKTQLTALLENGIDSTTLTIDSEYSEEIRSKSERFLYHYLQNKYGSDKVKWLNENGESYKSYDFELIDEHDVVSFIECKGTSKRKPTFYLTIEEWKFFLNNKDKYQIFRVFDVDQNMTVYQIENLFSSLFKGEVVPYLLKPEILKEGRVFLTIIP